LHTGECFNGVKLGVSHYVKLSCWRLTLRLLPVRSWQNPFMDITGQDKNSFGMTLRPLPVRSWQNPFMDITGQDKNSFGSSTGSRRNLAMIICPQNTNVITMVTAMCMYILVSVNYLLVAPLDPTSLACCTVDQHKSLDPVRIRQLRHNATHK